MLNLRNVDNSSQCAMGHDVNVFCSVDRSHKACQRIMVHDVVNRFSVVHRSCR